MEASTSGSEEDAVEDTGIANITRSDTFCKSTSPKLKDAFESEIRFVSSNYPVTLSSSNEDTDRDTLLVSVLSSGTFGDLPSGRSTEVRHDVTPRASKQLLYSICDMNFPSSRVMSSCATSVGASEEGDKDTLMGSVSLEGFFSSITSSTLKEKDASDTGREMCIFPLGLCENGGDVQNSHETHIAKQKETVRLFILFFILYIYIYTL